MTVVLILLAGVVLNFAALIREMETPVGGRRVFTSRGRVMMFTASGLFLVATGITLVGLFTDR